MSLQNCFSRYCYRSVCFYFFICLSFSLPAQLNSGNLTQLSERDGLPSGTVNAIQVDKQGYVWISTYNGLVKYNGYEFEKFYSDPNDSNAIQGMIAYSLLEDRKGRIWVGTNPNYIEAYNPDTRTFRTYDFSALVNPLVSQSPLYGFTVSSIVEDNKGNLFFGINCSEFLRNGLLYKAADRDEIELFKTPDGLEIQNVYNMHKDATGNIWIRCRSGYYLMDTSGKWSSLRTLFIDLPRMNNEYITDFDFSEDGRLWLLTRFGRLFKMDISTGKYQLFNSFIESTDPSDEAVTMMIDPKGRIWIGTRSGVRQFIPETGEYKIFNAGTRKDLEKVSITDFAFDGFGNLFIGTDNDGLLRYEEKPVFNSYIGNRSDKSALLPGWANLFCEASDGKLWVHSDEGISVLDPRTGTIESRLDFSVSPVFLYVTALWEQAPGEFYIGSGSGGLYNYSQRSKTLKRITLPGVNENTAIRKHIKDQKGNEWLATRNGVFKKAKDKDHYTRYDLGLVEGSDAVSNDVTDLFESPRHGLWIVSNNGLFLYHYDGDSIARHGYDKEKGDAFISQDINSVYEDAEGIVWVGQWQGGLARYVPETGEIKKFTRDDGLPSMGIQAVMGDDKNRMIWVSSFNGISRFDPKNNQFNNFSIDDGIQGSQFADGSYLKTSSGKIIFGGANGITMFNPDDFEITYDPPKVYLTDLKLFNKSVLPGPGSPLNKPVYQSEQVTLNHNQNNLTIDFIALHYSNAVKNKYSYILENYDKEWRSVVNLRQAFYPNLPPGKYIFRVKAANDKGVWNEEGASLEIIINPPWWQTWWAYCLYGLMGISLVFLIHRYQRNQVIKAEREKARSKELEQAREIEKAYNELKATQQQLIQTEKMASLGELTAGIAHEIQNPLNFVNNFSEVSYELADEMKTELDKGDINEAKSIAGNVKQNLEKVIHHGKRADAIVKSMLQHTRTSTGQKEPTDINALCDEYLRLAYHGLRAKDKSFQANYETHFDESLGKINVVYQDIGRVLLNLINNAFYAVSQKATESAENHKDFKPNVFLSTVKKENKIEIKIKDNGNGIPEPVKEKIFQPFFTTKPTGQGTGLGLSLSYDIIKAHGGELSLKNDGGQGAEFVITLPC